MTGANPWLIFVHVVSLLVWLGVLFSVSRMLVHALRLEEPARQTLIAFARRLYNRAGVPGGLLAILTGLVMLHGVFTNMTPGQALGFYFNPRQEDGGPSGWYVTFHVKMVAVAILLACDIYFGFHLSRLVRGLEARTGVGLSILAWLVTAVCLLLPVWLGAHELGVGPARMVGFIVGIGAGAGVAFAAWKLGRAGKGFMLLHGMIAAMIVLILAVILGKPLAGGL